MMSRTMAVRYNSWYSSSASSTKQQRDMAKLCVVWGTLNHDGQFFKSSLCPRFSFVKVLTVIKKGNDFRVSRDS